MQEFKHAVDLPAEACQCLAEAQALAEAGRFGSAAQKCERTLELAPNWAEAHHLYGTVLEQMGFTAKAKAAYQQATQPGAVSFVLPPTELQPRQPVAPPSPPEERPGREAPVESSVTRQQLLDQARAAREAGKLGSALRACEAALAADPDWAEAHNLRGVILDDMGHAEEAIAAYLEAVRLDPRNADARRNLLEAGAQLEDERAPLETVVIRTFSFPTEAEIARGRLEAEGIPAVVTQGEIVAANWLFSNMVGGVKLCIRAKDVAKARAVLDWDQDTLDPDERCPRCGSAGVRYEAYNLNWVYAIILLFKIPLPIKKERWTCRRCGASWKDKEA